MFVNIGEHSHYSNEQDTNTHTYFFYNIIYQQNKMGRESVCVCV